MKVLDWDLRFLLAMRLSFVSRKQNKIGPCLGHYNMHVTRSQNLGFSIVEVAGDLQRGRYGGRR